jgi:hypothetical protein
MSTSQVELNRLPSWVDLSVKGVRPALLRAVRAAAHRGRNVVLKTIKDTRGMIGGRLVHPPVDRGEYRASWQVESDEGGASLFSDAPHAAFIERGTRPHMPPLAPILAWVKRKKLTGRGKSGKGEGRVKALVREIQIARSIQRAIARRGTPPLKILERSIPGIQKGLDEEIQKALEEWATPKAGR